MRVILHDRRLTGRIESRTDPVIEVDQHSAIDQSLRAAVAAINRSGPVDLVIACHGYETHEHSGGSWVEGAGGQGLELCRESLQLHNISVVGVLKGHFNRIWLMSCSPAGTAVHQSRPFCREFAAFSDTLLIAAEQTQSYNPGAYDNSRRLSRLVLNFGAWEGRVLQFRPDGSVTEFLQSESPLP